MKTMKFLILIFYSMFFLIGCGNNSSSQIVDNSNVNNPEILTEIITGYDENNSAKIITNGDNITISGRFRRDKLKSISLRNNKKSIDINVNDSDDFSVSLSVIPKNEVDYLDFNFENGAKQYYILYENHWYFPNNGLNLHNKSILENIKTVRGQAPANYISEGLDKDEISRTLDEIKRLSNEICEGIISDYDKAFAISEWISENIYYDKGASTTSVNLSTIAISNVLETRRTVCMGFSNLYSALLESQGIRSVNIRGSATSSNVSYKDLLNSGYNHEWTAVFIDDRWVHVDSLWNTGNYYKNSEYIDGYRITLHFDISYEALSLIHRADFAEERLYFSSLEYFD